MTRRLLLGSADHEIVERVRSVADELGDELVSVATTSPEVLEAVAQFQPDVLVVDETLGPVPVLDLIRQAARQDPFVGILLLSSSSDPDLFRVAMEAGARSVAPMGFTIDDLAQRIDGAAAWAGIVRSHIAGEASRAMGTGHVIMFAGGKGGVGTTTVAVHVALEAAATGRQTCLVDLDLQSGDVAALLNITHRRDVVDLAGVADEISGQALDDVLYRHASGLEVLLAPREGERGEEVTEQVARSILGALKSRFDVIVVDVGSVLTPAGAAGVEMADQAVVVATPDVMSLRGARSMARMWDRLQLRSEKDAVVLLNRTSRNVEVQPDLAARLARPLTLSPIAVPAAFRAFEAAANTGDPARVVDRDVRRQLARVAESLGARPGSGAAPRTNGSARALNGSHDPDDPDEQLALSAAPARNGRRPSRRRRGDAGQTAVEFMGLLPVLGIVLCCLIQGGLIGYSHIVAGHAAARAARVAVSPTKTVGDITNEARTELPGAWRGSMTLTVGSGGDPRWSDPDAPITVKVRTPAFVPGMNRLFGDALNVTSKAEMHFEGR